MPNDSLIPKVDIPDYPANEPEIMPTIPEDVQQQYAAPILIDKVRRIIIKGRIDGK